VLFVVKSFTENSAKEAPGDGDDASRQHFEDPRLRVQRTIPASLPPGEYVLEVFVKEQQDDASYYFRVMVE
jgi:hypothetical protein